MREKSAMSWKEAREEAQFRKSPTGEDEEEEDERSPPRLQIESMVHQVEELSIDNQVMSLT